MNSSTSEKVKNSSLVFDEEIKNIEGVIGSIDGLVNGNKTIN